MKITKDITEIIDSLVNICEIINADMYIELDKIIIHKKDSKIIKELTRENLEIIYNDLAQ